MNTTLIKKSMSDLPENVLNALFRKTGTNVIEKSEFLDILESIIVDDTLYSKDGHKWSENSINQAPNAIFKDTLITMAVNVIIKKNVVLKNRFGNCGALNVA